MVIPAGAPLDMLLQVTRRLAAPFDLLSLLAEVAAVTRHLLHVERASVWLLDRSGTHLVLQVSVDAQPIALPIGQGLVGACAQAKAPVLVLDCYADPRFNPAVDRDTGFITRQCLCLPLLDPQGQLTGVLQCLNPVRGTWDAAELTMGEALAAQCAVALQRVQGEADRLARQTLEAQLLLAQAVQRASLPATQPQVAGWELFSHFQPAEATGGDTFDCRMIGDRLLLVVADAAGHGIAPALAVV